MQQCRQSRVIMGVLSLAVLVGAALTSSQAQADTGAGPYYAPPAWDRTLPSSARFMVLTNFASAAVLDRETGLVWERSPAITKYKWDVARVDCTLRDTGNRKGWRLPSMPELASLIDPTQPNPTLPPGHPFIIGVTEFSSGHWSATAFAGDPNAAWFVSFISGGAGDADKANDFHVWCVRGGMNADQY